MNKFLKFCIVGGSFVAPMLLADFGLNAVTRTGGFTDFYNIDLDTGASNLIATHPNAVFAMAYDQTSSTTYYTPVGSNTTLLGFVGGGAAVPVATLSAAPKTALTIHNNLLYYVAHGTDDLYRMDVTNFAAGDTKIADLSGNASTFTFGDISVNSANVLYGVASSITAGVGDTALFSFDLNSGAYNIINGIGTVNGATFDSNDRLVGHNTDGEVYEYDTTTGARTLLGTTGFDGGTGGDMGGFSTEPILDVPEPTSGLLAGSLLAYCLMRRRR